jgi:hypothetical protein
MIRAILAAPIIAAVRGSPVGITIAHDGSMFAVLRITH